MPGPTTTTSNTASTTTATIITIGFRLISSGGRSSTVMQWACRGWRLGRLHPCERAARQQGKGGKHHTGTTVTAKGFPKEKQGRKKCACGVPVGPACLSTCLSACLLACLASRLALPPTGKSLVETTTKVRSSRSSRSSRVLSRGSIIAAALWVHVCLEVRGCNPPGHRQSPSRRRGIE